MKYYSIQKQVEPTRFNRFGIETWADDNGGTMFPTRESAEEIRAKYGLMEETEIHEMTEETIAGLGFTMYQD